MEPSSLSRHRVVFKCITSSVPQAYTVSAHLGENTWDLTRVEQRTDVSMSKECNWVDERAFDWQFEITFPYDS
ncbi:hypothetical protein K443DRAFT_682270 [Laccaria amethystina LaAM-08-1]|uniref:Uncharacterized protein n=1 Tax=Laccaria amethystina LaAM-08-1 TaxID=1095629 RepID=A0A0C9XFX1_9AGAR|nr:hypothetical protein K443DRAFT_682270 [Laccaria amethystina LaAM-08-1]